MDLVLNVEIRLACVFSHALLKCVCVVWPWHVKYFAIRDTLHQLQMPVEVSHSVLLCQKYDKRCRCYVFPFRRVQACLFCMLMPLTEHTRVMMILPADLFDRYTIIVGSKLVYVQFGARFGLCRGRYSPNTLFSFSDSMSAPRDIS